LVWPPNPFLPDAGDFIAGARAAIGWQLLSFERRTEAVVDRHMQTADGCSARFGMDRAAEAR
jgi:hypothetical protein